jgi:ribosomal protein S18 acetylase RimI-like enzyme
MTESGAFDALPEEILAREVAGSLFDLFRAIALHVPGAALEEHDGYAVHAAPPTNPMFRGVWGLSARGAALEQALDDALAWHDERASPFAFVWAGPGDDVQAIAKLMDARGIGAFELGAPGQVARLDDLDWPALERAPSGVTFRVVTDEEGLAAFRVGLIEGFGLPEFAADAWLDATRASGLGDAPWTLVLGELDGRPVATNVVFCATRVATVLGIATVPELRGRGIGSAVTLAGLRLARDRGYGHAVLFATDDGAPVYRRLGFHDAGVTINRWLWRRGDAAHPAGDSTA